MNSKDYMELAIKYAKKAMALDEVPVGAVLFDEKKQKLISARHNEIVSANNPLNHAEILVIQDGFRMLNSRFLKDTVIYSTLEPCIMCAAAISEARIKKIYFGAYDEKKGAIENNIRIFNNKNSNYYKPDIYGGIKEKECAALLKNFFISKRELN